jgi:hypothetical protein
MKNWSGWFNTQPPKSHPHNWFMSQSHEEGR